MTIRPAMMPDHVAYERQPSQVCPPVFPIRILSRKWSYFTLRALQRPMAFSDLQRELRFITNHILTRELKMLKEEGLVQNNGRYTLTPMGRDLLSATLALEQWSMRHKGCASCQQGRRCSSCAGYPAVVGIKR